MYPVSSMTNTTIKSFSGLKSWQEAHKLVIMIYKLTEQFPDNEQFGLTNQIRRAAVSITSNIAEGFSKKSAKEKRQFYRTAISSLAEVQNQLLISRDVLYISQKDFENVSEQTITARKLINGLIKSAQNYS